MKIRYGHFLKSTLKTINISFSIKATGLVAISGNLTYSI